VQETDWEIEVYYQLRSCLDIGEVIEGLLSALGIEEFRQFHGTDPFEKYENYDAVAGEADGYMTLRIA
jgi:hypothetical protein